MFSRLLEQGEIMIARYAGRCARWNFQYPAGTEIFKGKFGWEVANPSKLDVDTSEAPFEIWTESNIKVGQTLRQYETEPDAPIVTVVRVDCQCCEYDDDDVFDDEERYFYTAACRAATDEEVARFLEEESEKQAATKRDADFRRLFNRKDGEYIQGQIAKRAGEQIKVGPGFNIFGTGQELFVENEGEWVWLLTANGMDGDDWSSSNWGGRIALRYALTPERLALSESFKDAGNLKDPNFPF